MGQFFIEGIVLPARMTDAGRHFDRVRSRDRRRRGRSTLRRRPHRLPPERAARATRCRCGEDADRASADRAEWSARCRRSTIRRRSATQQRLFFDFEACDGVAQGAADDLRRLRAIRRRRVVLHHCGILIDLDELRTRTAFRQSRREALSSGEVDVIAGVAQDRRRFGDRASIAAQQRSNRIATSPSRRASAEGRYLPPLCRDGRSAHAGRPRSGSWRSCNARRSSAARRNRSPPVSASRWRRNHRRRRRSCACRGRRSAPDARPSACSPGTTHGCPAGRM